MRELAPVVARASSAEVPISGAAFESEARLYMRDVLGCTDLDCYFPHLRWIADHALRAPVPEPWGVYVATGAGESSSAGGAGEEEREYYFNHDTGESMWEHPHDGNYRMLFNYERVKLDARLRGGGQQRQMRVRFPWQLPVLSLGDFFSDLSTEAPGWETRAVAALGTVSLLGSTAEVDPTKWRDPPTNLLDPIDMRLFVDPMVMPASGRTVSYRTVVDAQWRDPFTREVMAPKQMLVPNADKRDDVCAWLRGAATGIVAMIRQLFLASTPEAWHAGLEALAGFLPHILDGCDEAALRVQGEVLRQLVPLLTAKISQSGRPDQRDQWEERLLVVLNAALSANTAHGREMALALAQTAPDSFRIFIHRKKISIADLLAAFDATPSQLTPHLRPLPAAEAGPKRHGLIAVASDHVLALKWIVCLAGVAPAVFAEAAGSDALEAQDGKRNRVAAAAPACAVLGDVAALCDAIDVCSAMHFTREVRAPLHVVAAALEGAPWWPRRLREASIEVLRRAFDVLMDVVGHENTNERSAPPHPPSAASASAKAVQALLCNATSSRDALRGMDPSFVQRYVRALVAAVDSELEVSKVGPVSVTTFGHFGRRARVVPKTDEASDPISRKGSSVIDSLRERSLASSAVATPQLPVHDGTPGSSSGAALATSSGSAFDAASTIRMSDSAAGTTSSFGSILTTPAGQANAVTPVAPAAVKSSENVECSVLAALIYMGVCTVGDMRARDSTGDDATTTTACSRAAIAVGRVLLPGLVSAIAAPTQLQTAQESRTHRAALEGLLSAASAVVAAATATTTHQNKTSAECAVMLATEMWRAWGRKRLARMVKEAARAARQLRDDAVGQGRPMGASITRALAAVLSRERALDREAVLLRWTLSAHRLRVLNIRNDANRAFQESANVREPASRKTELALRKRSGGPPLPPASVTPARLSFSSRRPSALLHRSASPTAALKDAAALPLPAPSPLPMAPPASLTARTRRVHAETSAGSQVPTLPSIHRPQQQRLTVSMSAGDSVDGRIPVAPPPRSARAGSTISNAISPVPVLAQSARAIPAPPSAGNCCDRAPTTSSRRSSLVPTCGSGRPSICRGTSELPDAIQRPRKSSKEVQGLGRVLSSTRRRAEALHRLASIAEDAYAATVARAATVHAAHRARNICAALEAFVALLDSRSR
jgi:hypothetical protein